MGIHKVCSFFGHRKVEITEELKQKLDTLLEEFISIRGVEEFYFGGGSNFDAFCHERVSEFKKKYPQIRRVKYACPNDTVCMKDYELVFVPEKLRLAGKAVYVERNQVMIDNSTYCVFYFDPSCEQFNTNQPTSSKKFTSGTKLAYEYALQRKRAGCKIRRINLWELEPDIF